MCKKTLKFDNIRVNKKEFHKSKQPINLDLINVGQIVVSDKFKHSDNGFKDMSFLIKDDRVLDKQNEIWDKIKEILSIKFHSMSVYDEKYMEAKVREFNDMIKTSFLGDKIPKEGMHYTCNACITIDSVLRREKKNYLQVHSEECKYRLKMKKMSKFIEAELESESELESDIELELKSELESDTE